MRLICWLTLPDGARVIDVGTGAGFPGVPLKLLRPDISLTLLDASQKKTDFIRRAVDELGIDAAVLTARAEEAAHLPALREHFDVALSRAMAPLSMLVELCAPFLRVGGVLAAWKGERAAQELADAHGALTALNCRLRSRHPIGPGELLLLEQQKPAPDAYPRRFAKIKSQPL